MSTPKLTFPRRMRLTHDREYAAVFQGRVRQEKRPIVVHGLANQLPHSRLGLSFSRKVNTAARRNRIRRLIREAFRLMQREFPGSYDLVVAARPHEPRDLEWYQQALRECVDSIHQQWTRRSKT